MKTKSMLLLVSMVLLLAACELRDHAETPYRVVLNEAIELAKSYGGILAGTAWSAQASKVSSALGQRYCPVMREIAVKKQLSNKGLERTRRVGVPAARAVVGVSPCRSTQCSTDRGAKERTVWPRAAGVAHSAAWAA